MKKRLVVLGAILASPVPIVLAAWPEIQGRMSRRELAIASNAASIKDSTFATSALKQDRVDGPEKIELKGTIRHPVMALDNETTGTEIRTPTRNYELEFGRRSKWLSKLEDLDGKTITVVGRLTVRPGVDGPDRRILEVSEMRVAEARGQ